MSKFKKSVVVVAGIAVMVFISACSALDIVGRESISSFDEVLKVIPDNVTVDEKNGGWSLEAPDGSVRFIWSEDYSKSPLYDVMLEIDAKPFVDAGLDTSRLPDNYTIDEEMLIVGAKLGDDVLTYDGNPTSLKAYEQIVEKYRGYINFHTSLDHFGVMLGDGNMFEWAKDMEINGMMKENQDKDIVFVLNPDPLIAAGVDPEKVEGWVFAEVMVMDEKGKEREVDKFLKPFDLK